MVFQKQYIWVSVLLCAILIKLLLHLYIITNDKNIGDEDAAAYAIQARSIVQGDGLKSNVIWLHIKKYATQLHAEDYWLPCQSLIMALSMKIFGDNLFAIKIPNTIGFCLLILATYLIGKALFTWQIAIIASVIILFSSDLSLTAIAARNEINYLLLLMVGLHLSSKVILLSKNRYKTALICGIVAGFAFLHKPLGMFILISFVLVYVSYALSVRLKSSESHTFSNLKNILMPLIIVLSSFVIIISVYVYHNVKNFKTVFPPLTSYLSAIYLNSFKENKSQRTIDSDLSHYTEMRYIYYDKVPRINYTNSSDLKAVIQKAIHETVILSLMIKRSYIIQTIFLFLMFLSFFVVPRQAFLFLWIFALYSIFNILLISFTQHTEQRYYIFLIPVAILFSSYMFFFLENSLFQSTTQTLVPLKKVFYWTSIASIILFVCVIPNIQFYSQILKKLPQKESATLIGEYLSQTTSKQSTIIMANQAYRIGFHAQRPTVSLPLAKCQEIQDIADLYAVTYMVLSEEEFANFKQCYNDASYTMMNTIDKNYIIQLSRQ